MQSTKTTFRRLAGSSGESICTARAQACLTQAEFRALLIRSEALNREYGLGETR